VHDIEIGAIDDLVEREQLSSMLGEIGDRIDWNVRQIRLRAEAFVGEGLGPADAAHLAFAEAAAASFVTCDDRLIRQCERIQPGIWCGSPVAFGNEENL
jgi:predicted nucleic acid-binding protein